MEELSTNITLSKIYFSDHDALRTVIKKNVVNEIHKISKNLIRFNMIKQ